MTAPTAILLATVVVLIVSFVRLAPIWREKSYQRGLVYTLRRNAQSCMILVVTDAALAVLNVLAIVVGSRFWIANLINAAVVAAVGYFNWRMRNYWLARMRAAEDEEASRVVIPDHLPEDLR